MALMGTMKTIISNALAGILMAVMNITVAISVAALMFAGTRPEYLAPGIVVLLIGTLVVGIGGTLFSGFGGVVSFQVNGDMAATGRFVDGLRLPYIGRPFLSRSWSRQS